MQGKGIVKFFLIALGIVSLIQFIFLLPTRSVENKAERFAESKCGGASTPENHVCFKAAKAAYLDSISSVPVFSIPLIKSYTYQDLKATQLNFGLDLKGGMSVLMQVDLRDLIRELADNKNDPALDKALNQAIEKQKTSQSDFLTLFADTWKETAPDRQLNSLFKRNETLKDQINAGTGDAEVVQVLRTQADQTFDRTYELLKQRIDKLGVVGPNVSPDKARQLILVELPGV
ncbi:MAG: protein translocase subunit SecDF, partial [Bacteroidota bacterium]